MPLNYGIHHKCEMPISVSTTGSGYRVLSSSSHAWINNATFTAQAVVLPFVKILLKDALTANSSIIAVVPTGHRTASTWECAECSSPGGPWPTARTGRGHPPEFDHFSRWRHALHVEKPPNWWQWPSSLQWAFSKNQNIRCQNTGDWLTAISSA